MKKQHITDEEILSYLMGDSSQDITERIKTMMKEDDSLRKRVESIAFIRGEIINTPVVYKLKERKKLSIYQLSRQFALGVFLFSVGIFTQSTFEIVSMKDMDVQDTKMSISAPLSWDDNNELSLM